MGTMFSVNSECVLPFPLMVSLLLTQILLSFLDLAQIVPSTAFAKLPQHLVYTIYFTSKLGPPLTAHSIVYYQPPLHCKIAGAGKHSFAYTWYMGKAYILASDIIWGSNVAEFNGLSLMT